MTFAWSRICAAVGTGVLALADLHAATFVVSNTADLGPGSLREAIIDANTGGGGTIIFPGLSGTINLASPLPLITTTLNILGPGTNLLTVSGSEQYTIFSVTNGVTTSLANLTIADSYAESMLVFMGGLVLIDFSGSAISNAGTMTVRSCVFTNCRNDGLGRGDDVGGAVYNSGTLNMNNCYFVGCGSSRGDSGVAGGCIQNSGNLFMTSCLLTNCRAADAPGICNDGTAILNHCVLTGMRPSDSEGNGGAFLTFGSLTLNSCVISNCEGGWEGGAIAGRGIIANNSVIVENGAMAEGGALYLYSGGTNYFHDCTITGNGTGMYGGGAIKNLGNTSLIGCTLTGNTAILCEGGAVYNLGSITMANCTLSSNAATESAVYGGGGIFNSTLNAGYGTISNAVTMSLTDCTIVSNTAGTGTGGGIQNDGDAIAILKNCIVANNSSNDFTGTLTSAGYNLIRDTNNCTLEGDLTGNIYGADPLLGPLQNNGGKTPTHALLFGSPAIDSGPANAAPYFDQRNVPRPQGTADDMGAFEYGAVPPPVNLAVAPATNGCLHIDFGGIPGTNYTVLRALSLAGPWTQLTNITAGIDGQVICLDINPPVDKALYRASYP